MNFDLKLDPILKKVHYIFVIPCLKKKFKIQNPKSILSKIQGTSHLKVFGIHSVLVL